jgi:hypothetical protein
MGVALGLSSWVKNGDEENNWTGDRRKLKSEEELL